MSARISRVTGLRVTLAGLRGSRICGDASWALLGQVGSGLVLLLGTRLLTELVTPEAYGQVALMVGVVALGVNNFATPFLCAGMRLLPEAVHRGQKWELQRIVSGLTARAVVLALLVLGVAGAVSAALSPGRPWLFAAAGLLLAATVRRELGVQLLIAERRQREATLWQTTDSLLRPALAIGLVLGWGGDPALVLAGYALAGLTATALWARNRDGAAGSQPAAIAGSLRRDVLAYAWPLIPMELVGWFTTLGDRYVIACLMTAADVGLYAAAYTLVNEAFNRSAMVLLRTFQPVYFGHIAADRGDMARRALRVWFVGVVAVGLAGVAGLLCLQDWVAQILLADTFRSAAVLMPVIGAGCALQAVAGVLAQPLYARKRTRPVLWGRLAGAVTAAVSIPLMVSRNGLMGAALAAPLYFGTEALVLLLVARCWTKDRRPLPPNIEKYP